MSHLSASFSKASADGAFCSFLEWQYNLTCFGLLFSGLLESYLGRGVDGVSLFSNVMMRWSSWSTRSKYKLYVYSTLGAVQKMLRCN
jgi:hypothetical protein